MNWTDLVTANPMLIEIIRFRRKFFSFSGPNSANTAMLGIIAVCYVGLNFLVLSGEGGIPPMALVMLQTGLFTLFCPAMLHGAIAGERERRSWDLLLVAPITKAQIVAGKFIGALAALGLAATLFGIPIVLSAILYEETNWYDLLLQEIVSLSFAVLVGALTILFSARVKRGFMALGATIGMLMFGLIVAPAILAALLHDDQFTMPLLMYLHPFITIAMIDSRRSHWNEMIPPSLYGWPQMLVYLGLTVVFVSWAIQTLYFAENEVKFLPKGKDHHA
jgi:ABC-type transport system involved in multi-copper enzyme maturation permease subunit